jgi:predicted unusual protein kinase regulating ubiquinone biosynthesis (AarF/ABC1/UbiB family)
VGTLLHVVTTAGQAKRYAEFARLLVRNRGTIRLATDQGLAVDDEDTRRQGERLAEDLEEMGPTFVKLGQLLSTRSDLLPPGYLDALSRLQDEVAPFSAAEARAIVEEELDRPLSAAFAEFSERPLASASLGQVHRARLRDGRRVVVKVQRPGIEAQVASDLAALDDIAGFLDGHTDAGRRFGFQDLLDEFRRAITDELDYRHEAANLVHLAEVLEDHPLVTVPRPIGDLTTRRVLTMDEVPGHKVTDQSARLDDDDRSALADALLRAYLEQIFVHGFFHADPHPGNVLVTPDGRLALVDLGMVGHLRPKVRGQLVKLLLAVDEGRGQDAAEVLVDLGTPLEDFDREGFLRSASDFVARRHAVEADGIRAGETITGLSGVCGSAGLRPAPELSMLARALLSLETVVRCLDAGIDPSGAIHRHAAQIFESQMHTSRGGVLSALVEAKDLAEHLPARVNRVMEALSEGRLEVRVRAFDEAEMLSSLTKIANRLAMGLVIAALLLGAALLTKSYPRIALGCFALAAVCGLALMLSIALADRDLKIRLKRRRRG